MSTFKAIREFLKLTQAEVAKRIGCTQGRVWQMEHGDEVQPEMARRLIAVASESGLALSMDHVYGLVPLPEAVTAPHQPEQKEAAGTGARAASDAPP